MITLRPVDIADGETFFEQQADPIASDMAKFPSRDRETFLGHFERNVMGNPDGFVRTVLVDGQIAGNVLSWLDAASGHRMMGYWLGRDFWGRGIASEAVHLYLLEISDRPIYADVATTNIGSRRVLEKNGFEFIRSEIADDGVELLLFVLGDGADDATAA